MVLMRKIFGLTILLGMLTACDKGEDGVKNSGEVVLSSERILTDTYRSTGFSFEKGKNVPYPPVGGIVPDIVVVNETDVENNITGADFSSPNNLLAFHRDSSFSSLDKALKWFNDYKEVTAGDFLPLATNLALYQVWTVQTTEQKYAKLVIKDIEIKTDSPVSDYIEVTIEYTYQPDGSKIFSD